MTRPGPGRFPDRDHDSGAERFVLRLYVTGSTPSSLRAIRHLRDLCEELLRGVYDLEIIDIYQHPARAAADQIIAAPTLIKVSPAPRRVIIGDLSDRDRVVRALGLPDDGVESGKA